MNLSDDLRYFLAVMSSCSASLCMSTGLILMKLANLKVEKGLGKGRKFYCQIEFFFGGLCLCLANCFNLIALSLGNILIIASTACVTIVFNAILSPLILGEKFKPHPDGTTVLFISLGSTLAATQIPSKQPVLTDEVIQ